MSGICGIVALHGPSPTGETLSPALDRLRPRGPDGTRHWQGSRAALGHTLLTTTPEAAVECLPLRDPDSGCVITADVRLDNREALADRLGLDLEAATVGDGQIILRAYLTWGDACPEHLLGDFAFAIWDPRANRLFAARDQVGMKQLIYGSPEPGRIVFASDARAVRDVDPDRYPLSEERIVDYLEDFEGIDTEITFFEGILRLPPAHRLRFDATGLEIGRYWELTPGPELKLPSDEAYAEAFLAVFTEAVRARLRCAGPVGSMLSGGMDSTSVVAVAAGLLAEQGRGPLPTFSAVGPDPGTCPETRASLAASAIPNIAPTRVDYTRLGDLAEELATAIDDLGEPFDGNMNLPRAVYLSAARAGMKVVLDGVAGDVTVSGGDTRRRFARRLQIRRILEDARGERAFWGGGPAPWRALLDAMWRAYVPEPVRMARRRLLGTEFKPGPPPSGLVSPDLAARVNVDERRARLVRAGARPGPGGPHRPKGIEHPNLVVGRERYDRVASARGIEPRDPFLDLRVIDFCLSLPPEQIEDGGWPKLVLRRAMAGLVPDAVRWRRGRDHLGTDFTVAMMTEWQGRDAVDAGEVTLYAKTDTLPDRPAFTCEPRSKESWQAFRLFILRRWLAGRAGRGVADRARTADGPDVGHCL